MIDADAIVEALPAYLRSAVAAGWRGMTLVDAEPVGGGRTRPVLVVASPDAERLVASRAPLGVRLVREGPAARMLVLAMLDPDDGPLELGMDLAFPEARELLRDLAAAGEVLLVVVGPRAGSARAGRAPLGAGAREVMFRGVAEAGEWRTDPLGALCEIPAGEDELPRLVPLPAGAIALQLPLRSLAALVDPRGWAAITLEADGDAPALRIQAEGLRSDPAEELVLRLDSPAQRELAAMCAERGTLVLIGVLPGDERFLAHAHASLGEEARDALARTAALARES